MDKFRLTLANAAPLGNYHIREFSVSTAADRRLLDLGFVKGTKISVLAVAPFGLTFAIFIRGSVLCIRKDQAQKIFLERAK